jgi:hypothetical protein
MRDKLRDYFDIQAAANDLKFRSQGREDFVKVMLHAVRELPADTDVKEYVKRQYAAHVGFHPSTSAPVAGETAQVIETVFDRERIKPGMNDQEKSAARQAILQARSGFRNGRNL